MNGPDLVLLIDRPDMGQEWYLFTGDDTIERVQAVAKGFEKRGDRCTILKVVKLEGV